VVPSGAAPQEMGPETLNYVYAGRQELGALLAAGHKPTDEVIHVCSDAVASMAAWRATKLIYHFDSSLLAELVQTPLQDDMPVEMLRRLPAGCFFLGFSVDELPAEMRDAAREEAIGDGIFVYAQGDKLILSSPYTATLTFDLSKSASLT